MAISHVGSNTQDSGGAQSLTFSVPGAVTTDDLIIVEVKQSENTGAQIWDDDGGGGNGYTRAQYNRTTSGRDQETAVFWKFATSGSEPNPTFTWNSGGTNEPMSGIMEVYRGVDKDLFNSSLITYTSGANDANPPNPLAATIPTDNCWVVVFHAATHDDISSVAAPTGFTLRSQIWNGTADDHRNNFSADISNIDIADDPYTPPDWGHSVLNTTPEYHCYTVVLPEEQPIAVTGGTAIENFSWGATNLTITGKGFGTTQGIGKVEYWDDLTGTTKTIQTIDSWSDTSIQIDTVQGSLPNNTTIYLVVTNNLSQQSSPQSSSVGILPYKTVLDNLNSDHKWLLDNDYNDTGNTGPVRNMTNAVVGSDTFVADPICEDTTHSYHMTDVTARREIADSPNMNITISSQERTIGCWIELGGIQKEMACFWKEGGGVQNLAFIVGVGNVLMVQLADVATTRDNVQAFSSFRLIPNRPYHFGLRYTHTENPKEMVLLIDGREQPITDGNPMTLGIFDSHSGDVVWGNPDNNLETGGTDISYTGPNDLKMAAFCTWSDNSANTSAGALEKDSEIRDLYFRRGAIPKYTITSDTQVNMQSDVVSTLDDIEVPDWPLGVRIEAPSSGADLTLILKGTTFNERVSDNLEWRGAGTLTLKLTDGAQIDSSKIFSTGGGTVSVINTILTTIQGVPDGAEWRLYEASVTPGVLGGTELDGVESKIGSGDILYSDEYSSPTNVVLQVMKTGFKELKVLFTLQSEPQTVIVELEVDTNQ